mmetsp:Transcript_60150/g.125844  ORF Transcript_60150/g.125844 Transcript_60150/m.125844 type:complete len:89 (+) Transcript_60150:462-728(+)
MLDLLDDVFWMLPFSSRKQSDLIRQENNISSDIWVTRREQICAEHRLPDARTQLQQTWKTWIHQDEFRERREAATQAAQSRELPVYDE